MQKSTTAKNKQMARQPETRINTDTLYYTEEEFIGNQLQNVLDEEESEDEILEQEEKSSKKSSKTKYKEPDTALVNPLAMKPLSNEIKAKGFTITKPSTFPHKFTAPIKATGSKNIPREFENFNESDSFLLWFQPLIAHIQEQSNAYVQQQKICFDSTKIYKGMKTDKLLNWFCLFMAKGILQYRNTNQYWKQENTCHGLLGNAYFSNLLGMKTYARYDRILHCDIEWVLQFVNQTSQQYWNLCEDVSLDDDLYRWSGKGGIKIKNDQKADKTGIDSYKIVDSSRYCYKILFGDSQELKNMNEYPQGEAIVRCLDSSIPKGNYRIVIDAGKMGSIQAADYLHKQGRKFIISVAKNRPTPLWDKTLHSVIGYHQYSYLYSANYAVFSFFAKVTKKSKKVFVNMIINEKQQLEETLIERYNGKTKQKQKLHAPTALDTYNHCHSFVDNLKASILHVRNPFRARRPFRAKYHELFYTLLHNLFVWYKHAKKLEDSYSFVDFILALLSQLPTFPVQQKRSTTKRGYSEAFEDPDRVHELVVHELANSHKATICSICKHRTHMYCIVCERQKGVAFHVCNGICNVLFHNPSYKVNTVSLPPKKKAKKH